MVLLLGLIISSNLIAQDINWEVESEKKFHWLETYNDSLLIAGSKNTITAYNSITGEIVWEINDFNNVDKTVLTHLSGTDKAIIIQYKQNFPDKKDPIRNKMYPYLLDVPSGEIIADHVSMDIYHSLGGYRLPNGNLFFYSYDTKKNISLRVIDLQSGNSIWVDSLAYKKEKPKILKEKKSENISVKTIIGNQPPVFDTDSTMIILDDKKYVRKWNFHTGEILWEKEFKQRHHIVKKDNFAFAQLNSDSTVLYMVVMKSLCAIDVSDGSVVWQTDKINKRIKQITQNESDIILKLAGLKKERRFMYLGKIDKADGKIVYITDDLFLNKNDSHLLWQGDKLVIYVDNYIYTFDHEKNESVRLPNKIKFKHGDKPQKIYLVGDSYYIQSSQNLMQIDTLGNIVFHTEVQPPDMSLGKTLLFVAALGFSIYSDMFFNLEVPEYKSSDESSSYLYMLKKNILQEGSKCDGIAKINFLTGELVSELCLNTKTPIYAVDEVNDCIYYVKDKKTIICQSW